MKRERITAETCLTCGFCCVAPHDQKVFCDVTVKDLTKVSRSWARRNVELRSAFDQLLTNTWSWGGTIKTKWQKVTKGPLKGSEVCQCVALQGQPGSKVKCRIYNNRPRICRVAIKPGDTACRELRSAFKQEFCEASVS